MTAGRGLAWRTLVATVLLIVPVLTVAVVYIIFLDGEPGYFIAMLAVQVIVVVGLLRQARWGWWVAVSLGSMWLVSGVLSVISIVTSPLLWASPLLAPLVLCYVASLIAALVLLFTPRGRAPFRRPLAPPVTVP